MAGKPNGNVHPLIAALRSARERWVPLEDGKRVKIRRPAEAEFSALFSDTADGKRTLAVEIAHVQRYAVDWEGITEADLLGQTIGSQDPVPFDAALWSETVSDRVVWCKAVAEALLAAITEHMTAQATAAGNSPATSPPGPADAVATVQTPAPTTTTAS